MSLLACLAPPRQGVDGLPERGPALGEGVRKHVVGERNPVQDARRLQFPQPSGEDVRGCAEFALEVAVALCAVEEAADDQERPALADEFERCGQAVPSSELTPQTGRNALERSRSATGKFAKKFITRYLQKASARSSADRHRTRFRLVAASGLAPPAEHSPILVTRVRTHAR